MLPFALFGLLGLRAAGVRQRAPKRAARGHARDAAGRVGAGASTVRRPAGRLASLLVLGGWFAVEAVVLSLSKGIVHPYYVSALAPGAAAMAGAGAVAFVVARARPGRSRRIWALVLALLRDRRDGRGADSC